MPPRSSSYRVLAASAAVRKCLKDAGMAVDDAAVIYPGARVDLFGGVQAWPAAPPNTEWNSGTAAEGVFRRSADG